MGVLSVYRYLDYRAFLRDYYVEGKTRGLSYRSISRRAGVKSSNYFKLIIDGQRNLTDQMAVKFGAAVGLEGTALDFFCDLVRFEQAKTTSARAAAYERLSSFRRYREIRHLDVAQADYHSKWFIPAVRELSQLKSFVPEPQWICEILRPKIKLSEAKRALQVLLELGLLVEAEEGGVKPADSLVTTGAETRNVHVVNYHRSMIRMGAESMDRFAAVERDISGLTLTVGAGGVKALKERLARFRRELLELSELEKNPEQVVQINVQPFPLSCRVGEEGEEC